MPNHPTLLEFARALVKLRKQVVESDMFPVEFRYRWGRVMLNVETESESEIMDSLAASQEDLVIPNGLTVTMSDGTETAENIPSVPTEVFIGLETRIFFLWAVSVQ